jgi:hypothetical protein
MTPSLIALTELLKLYGAAHKYFFKTFFQKEFFPFLFFEEAAHFCDECSRHTGAADGEHV